MKRIIKFKPFHYVHLDSYGVAPMKQTESFVGKALVFITATSIAAITVGAMLGYDITQFNFDGSTQRVPIQHSSQVETKR
jgi:hypothetical protein